MQDVVVLFSADFKGDHLIARRSLSGFAASNEVGTRPANGVFDDVGDEGCREDGDDEAQDGDVKFVRRGTGHRCPGEEQGEGEEAGIDEEPDWGKDVLVCMYCYGK